ncbi:hypothetical protein [Sphingomonas hengshuiensis]|uniref:hypothetical protein n=1 Tax=Sphingomonas hengshuiensis TaxID=1609977 RepID=UPI000696CD07|nr:hypothetical protein [Sphingomonas hengshuiensis]
MRLRSAPLAATVLGVLAAIGVAAMPGATLESLVTESGLPSVIAAAEPPLGMTARALVALGVGLFVAGFAWLLVVVATGGGVAEAPDDDVHFGDLPTPVIRRADAHPDAPPRPPLRAMRDLGTPFLEVRAGGEVYEVEASRGVSPAPSIDAVAVAQAVPEPVAVEAMPAEQALPDDLEQPLAAFDPQAIPAVPMPPPLSLKPLRPTPAPAQYDDRDRFDIFALSPPCRRPSPPPSLRPRPRDEAVARPEAEASVHALLERLERGAVRRGLATGIEKTMPPARSQPPQPEQQRGLEEALVTLRNLARRA